jgi:hypothetical protein
MFIRRVQFLFLALKNIFVQDKTCTKSLSYSFPMYFRNYTSIILNKQPPPPYYERPCA